jgi:hypothetical protein
LPLRSIMRQALGPNQAVVETHCLRS